MLDCRKCKNKARKCFRVYTTPVGGPVINGGSSEKNPFIPYPTPSPSQPPVITDRRLEGQRRWRLLGREPSSRRRRRFAPNPECRPESRPSLIDTLLDMRRVKGGTAGVWKIGNVLVCVCSVRVFRCILASLYSGRSVRRSRIL